VTPDEIKRTALSAIECFNDRARLDDYFETLYEDNLVLHGYTPEPLTSRAAAKALYEKFFEAFPDLHAEIEAMYVEGNVLTVRLRFSGTQTGAFQGLPPSGRSPSPASRCCASVRADVLSGGRWPICLGS
jgi:predicted ester cyclase